MFDSHDGEGMHDLALALGRVRAGWPGRVVFERLDLTIPRGRTTALVGPGGSGKSSLLRLIDTLVHAHASPSAQTGRRRPLRAGPSSLHEPAQLHWEGAIDLRARSCVRFPQGGLCTHRSPDELARAVGLEPASLRVWLPEPNELSLRRPLSQLSPLTRRLLSLRLVTAAPAELLLLDEPTAELRDPWLGRANELLLELRRAGRTCVIVSHHQPLVRSVSDRVVLLVDGELIEEGDVEQFFHRPRQLRTRDYLQWGA